MARPKKRYWKDTKPSDVKDLERRVTEYVDDLMMYKWEFPPRMVKTLGPEGMVKDELMDHFEGNKARFDIFRKRSGLKLSDVTYTEYLGMRKTPTYLNLAVHLNVSKATIYRWKELPGFRHIFEIFETIVEADLTDKMITDKGVKTGVVFYLKNHYGYADSQEETIRVGLINLTDSELLQKVAELQKKLGITDKQSRRKPKKG